MIMITINQSVFQVFLIVNFMELIEIEKGLYATGVAQVIGNRLVGSFTAEELLTK